MIRFGQGIGLLIEAWKITQVVDIRLREDRKSIFGYSVSFDNKKELTKDHKKDTRIRQARFPPCLVLYHFRFVRLHRILAR